MIPMEDRARPESGSEFSRFLVSRLKAESEALKAAFGRPGTERIRCCWLDDVLPERAIEDAHRALPPSSAMVRRENLKERKFVSADLDALGPPVRELVLAFAQQPVADAVAEIMGKERLEVDPRLYNGGITAMMPGDFMCPHLDNSHDYNRERRREVVLLYYISPGWRTEYGGVLELWDKWRGRAPRPIGFKSNRLVILETTERSWHSIQPIVGPQPRVSLTSYFYAPATEKAPLRLTRFTSWPGQPFRAALFSGEFYLRSSAARLIGRRITANRHAYRPREIAAQQEAPSEIIKNSSPKADG